MSVLSPSTTPADAGRTERRVVLATDSLSNGGAERQLALLAMNLPEGWTVEVWSLDPGEWAQTLRDAGVPVCVFSRSWRIDITPAMSFARRLAASRPDFVYVQGWMSALAIGPTCLALGIPLVDSRMRGARVVLANYHKARLGLAFSNIVVANSAAGLAALKLRSKKGRVIRNGFDLDRVLPRCREPFSAPPFTVVMAARMAEVKDWDLFLSTARVLASDDARRWRFLAVGGGPEKARLIKEGNDLVALGVVQFLPEVADVMPLLSDADVGVLFTDPVLAAEGCSNSLLEYMAAGLPVVCNDSGGNREVVIDQQTGFIVTERDPVRVAEKLAFLAHNREIGARMGASGARRVEREFSIDMLVQQTIAAFLDAQGRRHRHSHHCLPSGRGGTACG